MKIVYLMRFWPVFGGGETVTRTLANEMCKRGHEVHIIYLWDRTNNTKPLVDTRIQEHKLSGISNVRDGAIKITEYRKLQKELTNVFTMISPDIVVDQWLPTKQVSRALKGLNSRLIKCHHGSVKHSPVIRTLKQKIFYGLLGEKGDWIRVYPEFKKDYVYSDAWVLLSEGSKKEAEILLPWADKSRLHVITNPLPYHVSSDEIDLDCKQKNIVFVGRVIRLKRVDYILKAWSLIENSFPDWRLLIVGDGDYLDYEKKYAKELRLKNVSFEGFQDSKPYLIKASILTMASAQEGFGMVLVEAQQCGCVPVVFNSFPTVTDIIQDNENGLLVKDEDIEGFAKAISNLINNSDERKRLAMNAMRDSEKFSVQNICNQWESLFDVLTIRRGGELSMKVRYIFRKFRG